MKLWNALRQRNKRRSSKVENGILTLEGAEDTDCDPETEEGNDNRYPRSSSVPIELGLGTPNVTPCDDPTSQMKSYNDINLLQNGTSTPMRDSPVKNGLRVSPTRSQVNGRQPHTPKQQPSVNLPRNGSSFDKSFSSSQKKKSSNWFSMSSYKQKSEEFHKLFKDIPSDERLLVDYSCAMQKDLLVHGRIYVSQNWICFYANILFKWETTVVIPCHQIKSMTKEKTARFIPNAIQISTHTEKYFFSTFTSRDKSYLMMFRVWQNALLRQPLSGQELWQLVHDLYGTQLGLTASDDDYLPADSAQESDSAQAPEVSSIGDSGSAVTHQNLDMPVSQSLPASIDLVDTPPQDLFTDCTDTSEDECKCCMCCGQCGACLVCFHSSIAVFSLSYYFDFNHHISQPTSFGSNV
ncbi:GRAMD1B [Bugula neritina]|uniref:GRAMD1B n=1 Tax=Bugula neritina TaxID=10212 RepID=A0A7J7JPT6_BUGNE|nr:GRAMD1B [Bugula neritina]